MLPHRPLAGFSRNSFPRPTTQVAVFAETALTGYFVEGAPRRCHHARFARDFSRIYRQLHRGARCVHWVLEGGTTLLNSAL